LRTNCRFLVVAMLTVPLVAALGACDRGLDAPASATRPSSGDLRPTTDGARVVVRTCRDRVEGAPGLPTFERREDLVVGAVVFDALRGEARRARKHPSAVAERYSKGEGAVKLLAGIRAGRRMRLVVAPSSRAFVGFVYGPSTDPRDPRDTLAESERIVEFQGCPKNQRRRDGRGQVGVRTYFAGGLLIAKARCVALLGSVGRAPERHYELAFGVPARRC
jgi:hypothetical protein